MSEFYINPNRHNGYPSIDTISGDFSPVQQSPYPKNIMYSGSSLFDGYPVMYFWGKFSPVQESPYPKNMFSCDKDKMFGYPAFSTYGEFETFSAFKNAENLAKAVIPESVKYICDYAFWNTALKKITIARDCKYFPHSFPEECEIEFYEE